MGFEVHKISSFSEIKLHRRSLIFMDVDETLIDVKDNLINPGGIIRFFKQAKEKNCAIVGITARSHCYRKETIDILKDLGIIFDRKVCYHNQVYEGCIFTGGDDKGPYVIKVIKNLNRNFRYVYAVDDLKRNLVSINKSLSEYNVSGRFYWFKYPSHHD